MFSTKSVSRTLEMTTFTAKSARVTEDVTTSSLMLNVESTCPAERLSSWPGYEETNTLTSDPRNHSVGLPVFTWGPLVSLNYTLPTMITVGLVLLVVLIATAFGNLLVGIALLRYRYLRTISNYLIGNLALSDFFLATTVLPLSIVNECLGHWVFGKVICGVWLIMDVLYCTASLWNLCVIAFDRFTATLYPMWYRDKRSTKQAAIYVATVWTISTAICVPPILGWNDLSVSYVYDNRTDVYRCNLFQSPSYVLYSACGSFYIPFLITVFFYIRIFVALRQRTQRAKKSVSATNRPSAVSANRVTRPEEVAIQNTSGKNARHASKKYSVEFVEAANRTDARSQDPPEVCASIDEHSLAGLESSVRNSTSDLDAENDDVEADLFITQMTDTDIYDGEESGHCKDDAETMASMINNGLYPPRNNDFVKDAGAESVDTGQVIELAHRKKISEPQHASQISSFIEREAKPAVKDRGGKSNAYKQKCTSLASIQHRGIDQRELRATVRMAIIIAFFCCMWIGFFSVYLVRGWCSRCFIPRQLDAFFFWLGYSNSSINPILYTIFNDEFRRGFQKILGCYRVRDKGTGVKTRRQF